MNTRIILEAGCNHNGKMEIAIQIIDEAKKLGVWGVKFQKRDIEAIPDNVKTKPRDLFTSFGINYYEHRKVLEFNNDEMHLLKDYAEKSGLVFICSAFDEKSIYDLIHIDCRYIKLPSQLYSDLELQRILLEQRQYKDFKIFVSTGMHNWEEISKNLWIRNADVIFHCISIYPHELKEMNAITIHNLLNITKKEKTEIGFSSHDKDGAGIGAAVLAGAKYIERHYTTNKNLKGSDHKTVSSDYTDMLKIINQIEAAENILGLHSRECNDAEKKTRLVYRGF